MLRPSNKRAVANAVYAFCLLLLGISNAYTADEVSEKPSQSESVAIAKTVVEWLVLDDLESPTLQSNLRKPYKFSTRLRNWLKSNGVNKFYVNVTGANDGTKLPLWYDRATREFVPGEQVVPEKGIRAIRCNISIQPFRKSKNGWHVSIRISTLESSLLIKREEKVYGVDEVTSESIYD